MVAPGLRQVWPVVSCGHGGQLDERIVAEGSDGFQGHVAGALHRPFIVLLEQDGADQAGDGVLVGEDADDIGAALDLAIEAFQRIGAVDLWSVVPRFREGRLLGKLMKARTSASAWSIRRASFATLGLS